MFATRRSDDDHELSGSDAFSIEATIGVADCFAGAAAAACISRKASKSSVVATAHDRSYAWKK